MTHFLEETFPKIQRLAEKMGADIGFEDEAGVALGSHAGVTWGTLGQTPEIPVTGKRGGYNLLSVVTSTGTLRFSIKTGRINSEVYIEFLKAVLRGRDNPLILIVDRTSFHNSKKVRRFVRAHGKQLRVFFLPKYSPEMNPDEQVWNEVKHRGVYREEAKTKLDLKQKLYSALYRLQRQAERIRSFFMLPDTRYEICRRQLRRVMC